MKLFSLVFRERVIKGGEPMKKGTHLDCGKYEHWQRDPECENVKSGKTKPFRSHGANVFTQHYRVDADGKDENEHDQDVRDAIKITR